MSASSLPRPQLRRTGRFGLIGSLCLALIGLTSIFCLTPAPAAPAATPVAQPTVKDQPTSGGEPRYLLFWCGTDLAPKLARKIGATGDGRTRLLGFGMPLSPFDEEKLTPRRIHDAFAAARANGLAVMLAVDFHTAWHSRSDLWNWFDPKKPGYNPENKQNVEWFGWDGPPAKTRYLNWGVAERIAPPPCFTSKAYRAEVTRLVRDVIAPPLKEELAALERDGKGSLFAGVLVGSEPGIENYSNPDPETAKLMAQDGAPRGKLGYRALLDRGYSKDKPPADPAQALAEVMHDTVAFWCRQMAEIGLPREKLYPHVVAQPPEMSNTPIDTAFNEWSRPGWSTYPGGILLTSFDPIYAELQKHGNPPWAGAETNAGFPGGLVDWETYLGWHYNHGAVIVAINTGATGKELPDMLEKSAYGKEALAAYHKFLAGEKLVEKPVSTDIPRFRIPRKMDQIQATFKAWNAAGRDPMPIAHEMEAKLPPLLQAQKLNEIEALLDDVLRRLAAPPATAQDGTTSKGLGSSPHE